MPALLTSHAPDNRRTAMWLALAAITMMFVGLTSACVVSQGLGPAWKQIPLSPILALNTALLLLSSVSVEIARRTRSRTALLITLALGILFLIGQITVFRQLSAIGYHLNTGRQSSFFYVLASLHGLHVFAGILALSFAALRFNGHAPIKTIPLYWHFMTVLWLYLLLVLFL